MPLAWTLGLPGAPPPGPLELHPSNQYKYIVYPSSQHIVYPSEPHIVYPSEQHILYPSSLHILYPSSQYIVYLSQPHIFYPSQQHILYLSQPHILISVSNTFFIPVLHNPVLHTSLFLLLPEPKLLRSDLHVSISTYSLYQQKSYQYYNLKPKSCVLSSFVLILFIFTFFTYYILSPSSFLPLSPSLFYHLHIYPFSCLPLSLFAIINLSLTFYSPLLFFAYFIISPFLPLSSPFFFHQSSSSSCSHSSIFLSKYIHIFFLSTLHFHV